MCLLKEEIIIDLFWEIFHKKTFGGSSSQVVFVYVIFFTWKLYQKSINEYLLRESERSSTINDFPNNLRSEKVIREVFLHKAPFEANSSIMRNYYSSYFGRTIESSSFARRVLIWKRRAPYWKLVFFSRWSAVLLQKIFIENRRVSERSSLLEKYLTGPLL